MYKNVHIIQISCMEFKLIICMQSNKYIKWKKVHLESMKFILWENTLVIYV